MEDHILYIKGSSCPYEDSAIAEEVRQVAAEVSALKSAGHAVTIVGSPSDGFLLGDVEAAFQENPTMSLVIVDAHGNIKDGRHYLWAKEKMPKDQKGLIWATDFYEALAKFSNGNPLNVFMFSCGSGNGCEDAVKALPAGSTLVNLVAENKVDSYFIKPKSLKVRHSSNSSLAEQLFLGILCKGFDECSYSPQLSISKEGEGAAQVWNLWDLARNECLDDLKCNLELETKIRSYLGGHLPARTISKAIRTIELYVKTYAIPNLKTRGTPVTIRMQADQDDFYHDTIEHGLLGPMCAAGYVANREIIGAFQTLESEHYRHERKLFDTPEGPP